MQLMKIVVDPIANDYIIGKGSGNMRMEYYNKGDIKMFGNYTIDHGTYKFSLQEVIRKDFSINSGSTVTFNGDPLNANLDIKAKYTVNSVSLSDLGSEVPEDLKKSNVKVNCLMDITGNMLHPTVKLGIELPNESEEKQRISSRTLISTEDQINMQTLYLLGIGKFYTPDYANSFSEFKCNDFGIVFYPFRTSLIICCLRLSIVATGTLVLMVVQEPMGGLIWNLKVCFQDSY